MPSMCIVVMGFPFCVRDGGELISTSAATLLKCYHNEIPENALALPGRRRLVGTRLARPQTGEEGTMEGQLSMRHERGVLSEGPQGYHLPMLGT